MDQLMEKTLGNILASGPLAGVLLAALVVLWRENKALQARLLAVLEGIANIKEDKK